MKKLQMIRSAFANKKSETYVDTGVKILIAVVIGALLLAALYVLFDKVVMPSLNNTVKNLFTKANSEINTSISGMSFSGSAVEAEAAGGGGGE